MQIKQFAADQVKKALQPLYNKKKITRSDFKTVAKNATKELAEKAARHKMTWKRVVRDSTRAVVDRHILSLPN